MTAVPGRSAASATFSSPTPFRRPVALAPEALERAAASRCTVEKLLQRGAVAYGITTGFGELARKPIGPEQAAQLQRNLILSTAAGVGPSLPEDAVRTMMLLRLNALVKGVSGVRPAVLEHLGAMLNAQVHPDMPCQGSVGASGDLAPLAHLALGMPGEGEAWHKGKKAPAGKLLEKAGIAPLVLEVKEGLSLINGTQAMTALGLLAVHDGYQLLKDAQMAAAMNLDALLGTESIGKINALFHRQEEYYWASGLSNTRVSNSKFGIWLPI
jgi:histidine ammonia-lyase